MFDTYLWILSDVVIKWCDYWMMIMYMTISVLYMLSLLVNSWCLCNHIILNVYPPLRVGRLYLYVVHIRMTKNFRSCESWWMAFNFSCQLLSLPRSFNLCQTISMIWGAFRGWRLTLNFFRITNLEMLVEATNFERLLERAVVEIISARVDFQGIFLFWNLNWFLAYHIPLKILNRVQMITVLHWGFQGLLQRFQISSFDWKFRMQLIVFASHL